MKRGELLKGKVIHFKGKGNKGTIQWEQHPALKGNFSIHMNGALCDLSKTMQGLKSKWTQMQKKYGLKIIRQKTNQ